MDALEKERVLVLFCWNAFFSISAASVFLQTEPVADEIYDQAKIGFVIIIIVTISLKGQRKLNDSGGRMLPAVKGHSKE